MQTLLENLGASVAIGFIVLWTQLPNRVWAGGMMGSSATDATLTDYAGEQLLARIHVTRIFGDHEKWGFLRLGLLPLAVAEGVQLQIVSASSLTNALADLASLNTSAGGLRRLEIRNLEISLLDEKEPRLHAARARIGPSGALELSSVSVTISGGSPVSIAKATLQISGPATGTLRWHDGGKMTELFIFKNP